MFAAIGSKLVIYVMGILIVLGITGGLVYQYHFKPLNVLRKENKLFKINNEKLISEKNVLLLKINNAESLLAECKDSLKAVAFESKWSEQGLNLDLEIDEFNKRDLGGLGDGNISKNTINRRFIF